MARGKWNYINYRQAAYVASMERLLEHLAEVNEQIADLAKLLQEPSRKHHEMSRAARHLKMKRVVREKLIAAIRAKVARHPSVGVGEDEHHRHVGAGPAIGRHRGGAWPRVPVVVGPDGVCPLEKENTKMMQLPAPTGLGG